MNKDGGMPEHLTAQLEGIDPTSEHLLGVIAYVSAVAANQYLEGKITYDRWMEVEEVEFKMQAALVSEEYAEAAAEIRRDHVRKKKLQRMGDPLEAASLMPDDDEDPTLH